MKIFLDANILVAVLNKEYPLFSTAARIVSLTENPHFEVCTSPLCLAIAFYFAGKKSGETLARKKIGILSSQFGICPTDDQAVRQTARNPNVHDFEDGLQYYTAANAGCDIIITENVRDFYFSEIPVRDCDSFLKEFVF